MDITWWKPNGEPAENWIGVHRGIYLYDEHCRLLEMSFWDSDGNPAESDYGVHVLSMMFREISLKLAVMTVKVIRSDGFAFRWSDWTMASVLSSICVVTVRYLVRPLYSAELYESR